MGPSAPGAPGPGEFIELAEQTGFEEQLTLVLLDKALAEWSGMRADRRSRLP